MFPFTLSSSPNFQSLLVLHTRMCTHTVSVLTHFQQTSTEQGHVFSLLHPINRLSQRLSTHGISIRTLPWDQLSRGDQPKPCRLPPPNAPRRMAP